MKRLGAVACLLVLAGCANDNGTAQTAATTTSSTSSTTTTVAPTTTTLEPGVERFLAELDDADIDNTTIIPKDEPEYRDVMLGQGKRTCDYMPLIGYGGLVQGLLQTDYAKTPKQASVFVKSAIPNLCPQYSDRLP